MGLTPSQQRAYDIIMQGDNVFLSAPGGAGKTYLISMVAEDYAKRGKLVAICAPTGIAAKNVGGSTVHRLFGFKSEILFDGKGKPQVRTNRETSCLDVLVLDEISMCRVDLFSAVVASVQKVEIKQGKKIQIIACGDFFQLPPVMSEYDQEIIDRCTGTEGLLFAFQSPQWCECGFKYCELTEIVRQDDPEMKQALMKIRRGEADGIEFFNQHCLGDELTDATYLFGTIKQTMEMNMRMMANLGTPEIEIPAIFSGVLLDERVRKQYGYYDTIRLKVDARVMTTQNDYTGNLYDDFRYESGEKKHSDKGHLYYNGSCGNVEQIAFSNSNKDYVLVDFDDNQTAYLDRRTMAVYGYSVTKYGKLRRTIIGSCTQFPLQLAYAVTVHKSQGQTLSGANIDPYSFTHGQLYVALSRVKSAGGLRLLKPISPKDVKVDPRVTAFYDGLQNESEETQTVEKKVGRPSKYGQPTTTIRIPEGDAEAVRAFLESLHRND